MEEEVLVDERFFFGCEFGNHFAEFSLLPVDGVFGADEEVLQWLLMGGETGEFAAEDLKDGELHGEATLAGAALAEDTAKLPERDDAVPPNADPFGQVALE